MRCDYFDARACLSCALMGQPYDAQLLELQASVAATLSQSVPEKCWDTPAYGPQAHFRNKAKLAVGGNRQSPTFGILDRSGHGVDLRDCGLHEAGLHRTVRQVADFITELGLTPYDVPRRSGELKHVIITHSPAGESMIRFVMRSPGQLGRLRTALPALHETVPSARVVTVNLLPEHKASLEGDEEIVLTEVDTLPMQVNDIVLHLRPRSFFQTNTVVAEQLYRQAQQWICQIKPTSVLDLFCGIGGFALHAAKGLGLDTHDLGTPAALGSPGIRPVKIRGIEISPEAVASANLSASQLTGPRSGGDTRFETGDATGALHDRSAPDLVIVNPPRRGIGGLAEHLERSDVAHVLYSSCNATSLAADLRKMPSLWVRHARVFDMFPQTRHHEVLVWLER